ncbi:uncharacterized protein LY89DRAFT_233553 [Mollisia scopiformis]|uniref:Uncharacterized protein n=1 Tax=Mollisia scopiformis TaxID=149040 RepID=A0A194WVR7_MOLSC|nr:uncharacterized protein LY89DRAFT_233553 [Mollisia scopiformis]KUJ11769.1 hypothetical protein LY89DRAFT_233553 [Mollisia scopiformis]
MPTSTPLTDSELRSELQVAETPLTPPFFLNQILHGRCKVLFYLKSTFVAHAIFGVWSDATVHPKLIEPWVRLWTLECTKYQIISRHCSSLQDRVQLRHSHPPQCTIMIEYYDLLFSDDLYQSWPNNDITYPTMRSCEATVKLIASLCTTRDFLRCRHYVICPSWYPLFPDSLSPSSFSAQPNRC